MKDTQLLIYKNGETYTPILSDEIKLTTFHNGEAVELMFSIAKEGCHGFYLDDIVELKIDGITNFNGQIFVINWSGGAEITFIACGQLLPNKKETELNEVIDARSVENCCYSTSIDTNKPFSKDEFTERCDVSIEGVVGNLDVRGGSFVDVINLYDLKDIYNMLVREAIHRFGEKGHFMDLILSKDVYREVKKQSE